MRPPPPPVLLLLAGAAFAAPAPLPGGFADALAARSLLGPDIWSRVVRIDNAGGAGRNAYPRDVYALVFELSGILWFYCDADGTQSLSLRRGALRADEADPGPLFRAVSDGFGAWSWVDRPRDWRAPGQPPANACFIECVAALRRRIASGAEAGAPRLLLYYVDTAGGRLGHAVLLFNVGGARAALDPLRSPRAVALPPDLGPDAASISHYLRGGDVAASRMLAIEDFPEGRRAGRWVVVPGSGVWRQFGPRLSAD